jgi:hypothetical protein
MKKTYRTTSIVLSIILLAACGGGGGSSDTPASPDVGGNTTKSFTVSLTKVDAKRKSNGNIVDVNTSAISNNLTLSQKN